MDTDKTPDAQGKIDLECLWIEHFAYALHQNGILNDAQYKTMLNLINQEIFRKKERRG